ncbi:dynamin family protein [Psychrobacter cibarius]|uniref:dynamin family protein n=1 Tax=Psychrobacter cibarius TaxID=282669 RepID=UPI003FD271BD
MPLVNFEEKSAAITSVLNATAVTSYSSKISEMIRVKEELENNLESVTQQDRALRIAIVGQMKAGKSSFINALLFPVDILPKAATPMTAALTRIAYSDKPRIEIQFFSKKDWQGIQSSADEYLEQYNRIENEIKSEHAEPKKAIFGMAMSKLKKPATEKLATITPSMINAQINDELISCYELVRMAKDRKIDLENTLGKTEVIEGSNITEIAKKMHDYVGSAGRYTAVTKVLSLYTDDSRLKDIEIYDTPGFNDPVISRGMQTRKFLGQCDMVFLLSTISQYLTKSDLSLLREQLTSAGIDSKAVYLVGTQKDLVFRMDADLLKKAKLLAMQHSQNQNQVMIAAMMKLLDNKIAQMTKDNISGHLSDVTLDDKTRELLSHLFNEPTYTVSSICWRIAENLPNLPNSLKEPYSGLVQSTGYEFNANDLKQFSSIELLRKKVEQQKTKKVKLVKAKSTNLITGAQAQLKIIVDDITTDIDQKLSQLQSTSIEQLKRSQQLQTKKLKNGRYLIEQVIQKEVNEKILKIDGLIKDISNLKAKFDEVNVQKSISHEIKKTERDGFFAGLARIFDVGGYDYNKIEIVTHYAQVQDSIEQIEAYSRTMNIELSKVMNGIIDMRQLRKTILNTTIELFDTEDPDFDILSFKHQVGQYLTSYHVPNYDTNISDVLDEVIGKFSSDMVAAAQIEDLKREHKRAIKKVTDKVLSDAKSAREDVAEYFDSLEKTLTINIIDILEKNTEDMIRQLNDKEISMNNLSQLRQALSLS